VAFIPTASANFRSIDAAGNWTAANRGLVATLVTAIAVDPADPFVALAATSGSGRHEIVGSLNMSKGVFVALALVWPGHLAVAVSLRPVRPDADLLRHASSPDPLARERRDRRRR
jgi:hypothetical protein